ncbi:MAG TPA: phytanoyl-CoA dioxygenase family protein [Acetobacteraceae bacterium]|nr:phytanoyl-CoA dioxygenase family protein [Acetobacteraceae bacterium]
MPGAFKPDVTLPALWTDRPNWMTHLRALAATGFITQLDADNLAQFADHGWLIMPQAIEPHLVDTFVNDIHKLHELPGMFATTDFRGGREQKLNGKQPDSYESLFDLYVNLQSSRHVCMHPKLTRFLTLVFQAKVLAFQQLLFQRSNGHLWHQDTSVVVVDTPTLLVASWIALEDIVEGSGELAYYDRSHRLPHFMFNDGKTKYHDGYDQKAYARDLAAACQARQLAYGRFLAKKGDVFFWTADLVHRSHPRTLPEETSRMSCVTHYCPATSVPGYFNDPEFRGIEPYFDAGGFASSFYKLPNLSKQIRPVPRYQFYN